MADNKKGSLSVRFLGPSNYGLLSYGSLIIVFTTVSKLGMDSVVVAEIVGRPEKEGSHLGKTRVIWLMTSVLSFWFCTLWLSAMICLNF